MQQINLYSWRERGPYRLNAKRATHFLIGAVLLMIALLILNLLSLAIHSISLKSAQHRYDTLENDLKIMKTPLPKGPFKNLEEQTVYKEALEQKIKKYKDDLPFQPASMLTALSVVHNSTISLQSMMFENAGKKLTFNGAALNANAVFDYERKLHAQLPFQTSMFKTVHINEEKGKKQISFVISTESVASGK